MSILLCLRTTAKIIKRGSKYLINLKTLKIFSRRETRTILNVGLIMLNVGKMDNRSIMAIGVKGYIKNDQRLCPFVLISQVTHRSI